MDTSFGGVPQRPRDDCALQQLGPPQTILCCGGGVDVEGSPPLRAAGGGGGGVASEAQLGH